MPNIENASPYDASFMDQEFPIFFQRSVWPQARDKVFISDAVDTLADLIWASDDRDLDPIRSNIDTNGDPQHRRGILWTMVRLFTSLLTDGAMSTFVRPVGGTGTVPLRDHAWDSDQALQAVARGMIDIRCDDGAVREHWVFLDRVEFDLIVLIHSPAGGDPNDVFDNLRRRHDRLAEIVLTNLSAIAKSRLAALPTRAGPGLERIEYGMDPQRETLDAMFADARRILNARHQEALIERLAGWLIARFDEDPDRTLSKSVLKKHAIAAFTPYLTNSLFLEAWQVATVRYPQRAKAGRPEKARRAG